MLRRAIVRSFDADSRVAVVEYWGDADRRTEAVRAAAHLDADMLAPGALVEVWASPADPPDQAVIVASRAAPDSPDQTLMHAHDRLDNAFGPASLASRWYNRVAAPASPNARDAEFTASPIGANGWAWAAEPGAATGSGWSVSMYPHWLYVWQSTTANPNPAELRCTDPGNLPRYKMALVFFYPATSAKLVLRSVKDASNYTEFELSSAGIKAYKCIGGVRTQIGSTVPLYPMYYFLILGNHASTDYLTWQWGAPWGAGFVNFPADSSPGLRAADIAYYSLQFYRGTVNFETFLVDAVRFWA